MHFFKISQIGKSLNQIFPLEIIDLILECVDCKIHRTVNEGFSNSKQKTKNKNSISKELFDLLFKKRKQNTIWMMYKSVNLYHDHKNIYIYVNSIGWFSFLFCHRSKILNNYVNNDIFMYFNLKPNIKNLRMALQHFHSKNKNIPNILKWKDINYLLKSKFLRDKSITNERQINMYFDQKTIMAYHLANF